MKAHTSKAIYATQNSYQCMVVCRNNRSFFNMFAPLRDARETFLRVLLALSVVLVGSSDALASGHLYITNFAPFWYQENGLQQGVTYELMRELQVRVGNSSSIEPVPLKREMELIKVDKNSIGVVFWRPQLAASYTWIVKLLDDRTILATCVDSKVDITSSEHARNLKIGVVLGGPSESAVENLGFKHVEAIPRPRNNGYKLSLGRVEAVAILGGVAFYLQDKKDKGTPALRYGATLETVSLYLVGPAGLSSAEVRVWKSALESMQKDGTYEHILRKYHYWPTKN